jgi:hypothetical protein
MGNNEQKTEKINVKNCGRTQGTAGRNYNNRKSDQVYKMPVRGVYRFFFKNIFQIKIQYSLSESFQDQ